MKVGFLGASGGGGIGSTAALGSGTALGLGLHRRSEDGESLAWIVVTRVLGEHLADELAAANATNADALAGHLHKQGFKPNVLAERLRSIIEMNKSLSPSVRHKRCAEVSAVVNLNQTDRLEKIRQLVYLIYEWEMGAIERRLRQESGFGRGTNHRRRSRTASRPRS